MFGAPRQLHSVRACHSDHSATRPRSKLSSCIQTASKMQPITLLSIASALYDTSSYIRSMRKRMYTELFSATKHRWRRDTVEENVWKLCEYVRDRRPQHLDEFFVIFLSNEHKMIPIWKQHGGRSGDPVIWDYHVILLRDCGEGRRFIYDLDTALPFPCSCHIYIEEALRYEHRVRKEFRRKLRIIRAEEYLRTFASDRSHMKDEKNEWKKPPPPYPCIKTQESSMNLDDFTSMDPQVGYGTVCTLEAFTERFGAPV